MSSYFHLFPVSYDKEVLSTFDLYMQILEGTFPGSEDVSHMPLNRDFYQCLSIKLRGETGGIFHMVCVLQRLKHVNKLHDNNANNC